MDDQTKPSAKAARIIEQLKILDQETTALPTSYERPPFSLNARIKRGIGLLESIESVAGRVNSVSQLVANNEEVQDLDNDDEECVEQGGIDDEPYDEDEYHDLKALLAEVELNKRLGLDGVEEDHNPHVEVDGKRMRAIVWIRSLLTHVEALNKIQPLDACPGLTKTPTVHQYTALAAIEHNAAGPQKGILVADPPGFGKTLPAMMAVVRARATAQRPSIIVVPPSLVGQWLREFDNFFQPGTIGVFFLHEPHTPCTELVRHDVIITTYGFVMSQYRKFIQYRTKIKDQEKNDITPYAAAPERPDLSILADMFWNSDFKSPYLVLDEAHNIKNSNSKTNHAIEMLRKQAHACIMLTGSPVDNKWDDALALCKMIKGHPIESRALGYQIFSRSHPDHPMQRLPPDGHDLIRFTTFLNSWVIRRPVTALGLPPLTEITRVFPLKGSEIADSNLEFRKYEMARQNKEDSVSTIFKPVGKRRAATATHQVDTPAQWGPLIKAQQHVFHSSLVEFMGIARLMNPPKSKDGSSNPDMLATPEEVAKWEVWRSNLRINDNWKSSRVRSITFEFNRIRDLDPDAKVLIFDDSVFFLDVLEAAFAKIPDPIKVFRYDGRAEPTARANDLERFKKAPAPAIMLISRSAGGLGLNIIEANVVMICGVWWKQSDEIQAIGRVWRVKQQRPVIVIRFFGNCSRVEDYKQSVRDKKNIHNEAVMRGLVRPARLWHNVQ